MDDDWDTVLELLPADGWMAAYWSKIDGKSTLYPLVGWARIKAVPSNGGRSGPPIVGVIVNPEDARQLVLMWTTNASFSGYFRDEADREAKAPALKRHWDKIAAETRARTHVTDDDVDQEGHR